MAPATAYTDETLQDYMHSTLRATAQVLGWSVPAGSYVHTVNEALRAEAITVASAATNVARLEAQARRAVWQAVVNETAGDTDYTAANGTMKRTQIHAHALAMLAQCERHLALVFGVTSASGARSQAISNQAVW